MDLIKYSLDYVDKPIGLPNSGSICYLNTFIQSLLSCPSIFETINSHINSIQKIPLLNDLYNIYLKKDTSGEKIYQHLYNFSQTRLDISKINGGQQDANEGLMLFFEIIEKYYDNDESKQSNKLKNMILQLFEHRMMITIKCTMCNHIINKYEMNKTIDIQAIQHPCTNRPVYTGQNHPVYTNMPNNKIELDNNFLFKHINEYSNLEEYTCDNCSKKNTSTINRRFTMLPEILIVLLKKYNGKYCTEYQNVLLVKTIKNNIYSKYELISRMEHSGNLNGGHYWVTCKRHDDWYSISDMSITKLNCSSQQPFPEPSPNTYVLFYHFMGYITL